MFLTNFLLLVSRGRSYYLAPAYPMLLAARSAWLEDWNYGLALPAPARGVLASLLVIAAAAAVLLAKPVAPIHSQVWDVATQVSDVFVEMVGWPELAQVYAELPADEKPATAILAGRLNNPDHIVNEESTYHSYFYVCRHPRHAWDELWPDMRWYQ
jgi:hypothetical protein